MSQRCNSALAFLRPACVMCVEEAASAFFDNTFILAKIMAKVEILWEAATKNMEGINIILQMLLPFSFLTYFGDVVSCAR
jgi:hypothetical protein